MYASMGARHLYAWQCSQLTYCSFSTNYHVGNSLHYTTMASAQSPGNGAHVSFIAI